VLNFFNRNPLLSMQSLVDRAERIGVTYLEQQAVNGTITEAMVETVARTLNTDFDELVALIPDRRRPSRHAKAMAGLRKARLIEERKRFTEDRDAE
jgi:hypothetical protein